VVEALGLKDPILRRPFHGRHDRRGNGGHRAQRRDPSGPLIAAGRPWDDAHPVVDMFSTLPFEMPTCCSTTPRPGARDPDRRRKRSRTPGFPAKTYLVTNARQLGMAGRSSSRSPSGGSSSASTGIKAKTVIVWGDF